MNDGTTHWEGCEREHHECALAMLARLRAAPSAPSREALLALAEEGVRSGVGMTRGAVPDVWSNQVRDEAARALDSWERGRK